MTTKLSGGDRHFIKLIARDADVQGWSKVSAQVMPLVRKMPSGFVEIDEENSKVRLTEAGKNIHDAMEWL